MDENTSFGLTDEDIKNQKRREILATVKNFFDLIGPTVVRWINILIYYFIKFIKAFIGTAVKMILGKEV